MLDELRRVAMFTSGVAELTRFRAEAIVKDLIKSGDVRREQATSVVRELLETSKTSRQELLRFVRSEIQSQVATLGLASQRDLDRLERRVARLESETRSAGAGPGSSALKQTATPGSRATKQKAATKKTAAKKKATAKKTSTKKTSARKSTTSGSGSS